MLTKSDELWVALYRLGTDDTVADVPGDAIAQLVEFKIAEVIDGKPQLTKYGEKCFVVMESGDGVVPELNDMAAMENQ
jgi:hypothetical protein